MSEVNWQAGTNPHWMLGALETRGKVSERKLRLFACASCRCLPLLLAQEPLARAVEAAERLADGQLAVEELLELQNSPPMEFDEPPEAPLTSVGVGFLAGEPPFLTPIRDLLVSITFDVADALGVSGSLYRVCSQSGTGPALLRYQAHLLHDIFGSSLHPLPRPSPAVLHWNGALVVRMAAALYDDRRLPEGTLDPVRLAILADALEEAGADAELIEHLRGPGPHVRGCWTLDLLTSRK